MGHPPRQYVEDLLQKVEDLFRHGHATEADRARLHSLTRRVSLSDADLYELLFGRPDGFAMNALKELRDRYEERGDYTPGKEPPASGDNQTTPVRK